MRVRATMLLALGFAGCHSTPPPSPPQVLVSEPVAPAPAPVIDAPPPASVAAQEPLPSVTDDTGEEPTPIDDPPASKGMKWSEPSLRQGATRVSGRLPPEVVQRIVRQHFGRIRLCVESTKAHAKMRITSSFSIDRAGAVSTASAVRTTPEDPKLAKCVARVFDDMSFPQPEEGSVAVTYPILVAREEVSLLQPKKKAQATGPMWGNGSGGVGLSAGVMNDGSGGLGAPKPKK